MNTELLGLLKDWGSAGAVIVCVVVLLKHLARIQDMFNALVGNHLEHAATTQKEAAQIMASALDRLSEDCERRNRHK